SRLPSSHTQTCFFRCAIVLPVVALDASRHYVHRRVITTTRTRQDVIECQLSHTLLLSAVLAAELVAHVNSQALHARLLATAANVDVNTAGELPTAQATYHAPNAARDRRRIPRRRRCS